MDVTSHIHAHKARREKSQRCRSDSFEEKSGREDCSHIGAKKVAQGGNLPVDRYLLWSLCYAGGWPDICMRNWRWHKGMNLLTHGRTDEQENGACLTQLYVEQWSGIGRVSPCWHVDTYHLYLIMSVEDRPRERAVCGEKTRGSAPRFSLPSAVLHVTRGQERGKLKVSVVLEYRSRARPRARRRERSSMPTNTARILCTRRKINPSAAKRHSSIQWYIF